MHYCSYLGRPLDSLLDKVSLLLCMGFQACAKTYLGAFEYQTLFFFDSNSQLIFLAKNHKTVPAKSTALVFVKTFLVLRFIKFWYLPIVNKGEIVTCFQSYLLCETDIETDSAKLVR
jgi:hypothetical protein